MKSSLCNKRYVHPIINRYNDIDLSLYLFIKKDRILFSLCSLQDKILVAYGDYTLPSLDLGFEKALQEIKSEEDLFKFSYLSTTFSVLDSNYTLVPSSLLQNSNLEDYFNLIHGVHPQERIKADSNEDISIISSYLNSYDTILPNFFSNPEYIGFHSILLKYFYKIQQSNKRFSSILFLWGSETSFDLCIFHQKELVLFNNYPAKNTEEKLYYFLYACNQLKLDLGDAKLYLGGKSLGDKSIYENHIYKLSPLLASPSFTPTEDGANYFFLDQSFLI